MTSLRVKRLDGEPFRFLVQSESGREPLTVDLQALDFNGWCGCEDFEARRGKVLRENKNERSPASRCKHIQAARDWLLDTLMEQIADHLQMPEEALS